MSGLIVGLVLRTPITDEFNSEAKFIATVYADHAWEDGTHAHPAVDTVAGIVGLHERTVQRYLRTLEKMGMLILTGKGPRGTNQYSFPLESSDDGSVRLNLPRGGAVPPRQPARGGRGDRGDRESGDRESGGAIVSPKLTTRPLIHEEEENASPIFQISDELQAELKNLGVFVSVWKDIEKQIAAGWSETDVVALIDWMVKTRKDKPKAAQGFVTRVREGTKAPQEFYAFELRSLNGKWYPGKEDVADDAGNDAEETIESTSDVVPFGDVGAEIAIAWETVLVELSKDMGRASFARYVRDTKPISLNGHDELQVAAQDAEACAWLDSRLLSTIERLLVGILKRSVTVEFVVVDVAVETEVA